MAVIRGEQWIVTWSPQFRDDGVGLASVESNDGVVAKDWINNIFGIFSGANLPDPTFDFEKHWAYGELSNRNYYVAYKGKAAFSGGIGDVLVLNGSALRVPFGPCATTLPPSASLGSTTVDEEVIQGSTEVHVADQTQCHATDVICIGGAIPGSSVPPSAACEYAMVKSVGADSFTIYKHIEFDSGSGTLSAGGTISGGTSGASIAVQMASGREAHGDVTLGGGTTHFIVGESLSGTGGWTGICTRSDTGARFSHMIGSRVVEVTDHAEDGILYAGKTSVIVSEADDWASNDYMCVGYGSPYAEVRQITKSGTTMSFTKPLSYDHGHWGGLMKVTAAGGVYTHTICESRVLPAIQIAADYVDVDGAASLMRRYCGVKANRGSYRASEGAYLRMSIDDLIGRTMRYRDIDASDVDPWYSENITHVSQTLTTDEPYHFSYGVLTFAGSTVARLREFNLEVSNGLEPKYYVTNPKDLAVVGRENNYTPWEIREGKRDYRCSITVDVDPNERNLFADLCRMGVYTSVYKGFQIVLTFTRGTSDTITITLAPTRNETTVPAAGGDVQGCLISKAPHNIVEQPLVSVPLEIEVRSAQIVVQDDIQYYP